MWREEVKSIKTKIQKDCSFLDRDESDVKLEYSQWIVEDAVPQDEIENIMPNLEITIYTTTTCNKCRMLIEFLNQNNVKYEEKDANENWNEIKNTIFTSAPIIKVIKWDVMYMYDMDWFMDFLRNEGIL